MPSSGASVSVRLDRSLGMINPNDAEHPDRILPVTSECATTANPCVLELPPHSISTLRLR